MIREPMKCRTIDQLPPIATRHLWAMQVKLDGWRATCEATAEGVKLYSREGNLITSVPYVNEELSSLPVGTMLDGELLASDWNRTQSIVSAEAHDRTASVHFYVFDLLQVGATDAMHFGQEARWHALDSLFEKVLSTGQSRHIHNLPRLPCTQEQLDVLLDNDMEGAVIKKLTGRYTPGRKSPDWLKLKPQLTEDLECVGTYEPTAGSKYDGKAVGGLLCTRAGVEIRVGTGMNDGQRSAWYRDESIVVGKVIEVAYNIGATSKTGKVRHASFVRVRDPKDKSTASVRKERAMPTKNAGTRRARNYRSMSDAKVLSCLEQLKEQGDAYHRCLESGSGDPAADLAACETLVRERGL
jgi:ATP-dependent DNA ligase